MSDIITLPLNRLTAWKGNVRKTSSAEGIPELAASIAALGQLQSLIVREAKRNKFEVIAGRRRLLALASLAKEGRIAKDHPVSCIIAADTTNPTELSLAENVMRMPMHPLDQLEAFRIIVDGGATPAEVAARFGITELLVNRRLKLARLSPMILEAFRNEAIDLETTQAFTITDDHASQERVFSSLPEWNLSAHAVKRALTENEVPSTDKRVRFVSLEAYRAAGGNVRQDLFNDQDEGYLSDVVLLDELVHEKLAHTADVIRKEGWLWVETVIDLDYGATNHFTHAYPEDVALSEADQAELDRLTTEYQSLDSDDEADEAHLALIDKRIDELTERTKSWSPSVIAKAGALISLGHRGDIRIERGLIRPEDRCDDDRAPWDDAPAPTPPTTNLSATLMADLTAQRTAALRVELLQQPRIALAATVHRLALTHFYPGASEGNCLQMAFQQPALSALMQKPDDCVAAHECEENGSKLRSTMPNNPEDFWHWCLNRSTDDLLTLLAYLAALSINAVQSAPDRPDCPRLIHANELADALQLDMAKWFAPTADNYFTRINRSLIMAAIDEVQGGHGPALDKLKKGELAARAESIAATTGWLPHPLRASAQGQGGEPSPDAA